MRWKSHVRFGGRPGETDHRKRWHGAPGRSHVANGKLDECRRRVQNETLGHYAGYLVKNPASGFC